MFPFARYLYRNLILVKKLFVFFLLLGTLLSQAQGLRWVDEQEYTAIQKASIQLLKDLPAQHDLSKWFPPAGSQGQQGSCVGWAAAYAIKTYQEAVALQRVPTEDAHYFSPAFVYNQINDWGCSAGSKITDALNLLKSAGAAPMSMFPYNEDDCSSTPSSDVLEEAKKHTISDWKRVEYRNEGLMKTFLMKGYPILIGMQTDPWFFKLKEGDVYRVASDQGGGGHALVVVGYDDRRGAYKVFNSWGERWGTKGYGWIAYELFEEAVHEAYILENSSSPSDKVKVIEKEK